MKPHYTPLSRCRACGSENIGLPVVTKTFTLLNLEQNVQIPYSVCEDCQLIFQSVYVGDAFLNTYYQQSPMLRRMKPTPQEQDQNRRQSDFLARHVTLTGKSALEIGAHAGAFLMHLAEHYACPVYFDELSEEARNVLSQQKGLLDSRAFPELKVDVVILRHILEHIHDVPTFLNHVRSRLKDDGILYVEVPDWSWLDTQTDPLIFEHVSQFSTHNLILMMKRYGWNCDVVEKSCDPSDPASPNRVQRLLFRPTLLPALGSADIRPAFKNFYDTLFGAGNATINAIVSTLASDQKIALYPASHLTFSALNETQLGKANIVGIFDIDEKKHGKSVDGLKIHPAAHLKAVQPDIIFLFTMGYEPEIRESFRQMGLRARVISISQILAGDLT